MIPLNSRLLDLKRSGIRKYTNLAKTVSDCVMLTIGEPDFATPQEIKAAALTALFADRTHYAPNQGVYDLRQEIAAYETIRGMDCRAEQVLVTAGATGALFTALLGILNPGEEVIVPTPAFPLYESIIAIAGGVCVPLDLKKTDFQITPEALAAVMTPKTKAIILNSPHNPTGTVLSESSLAAVKDAVLGKPVFVICDNVYQRLSHNAPDLSTDEALKEQLLLCQSFSKPYAMTGWRVGYLIGPEAVMERLLLLHAAEVASIPTFLQDACITALNTSPKEMADTADPNGTSLPCPGGRILRLPGHFCLRPQRRGVLYPDDHGSKSGCRSRKLLRLSGPHPYFLLLLRRTITDRSRPDGTIFANIKGGMTSEDSHPWRQSH